jgi:hypothetical protein
LRNGSLFTDSRSIRSAANAEFFVRGHPPIATPPARAPADGVHEVCLARRLAAEKYRISTTPARAASKSRRVMSTSFPDRPRVRGPAFVETT